MNGARVPPALLPLEETQGEGTMCALWRGLTRYGVCCMSILDVHPAGSEDSARGSAVIGAPQMAPPLLSLSPASCCGSTCS